ncbi:helix-turn-helix transcriptional regulator [Couchioplanes azureus]|uniref:helix-turn-helix transcriptional regulator n=1 Tax=Couchioplanes caeruleus TaxID=56438 RepID=UPI001670166C|nr:AAA family ATPase [Couchioplanes caeruleus]GGQ54966.1 helix-turn-helix transcriptional regulator [Couchioplanes caeruleus subsp. azureus]
MASEGDDAPLVGRSDILTSIQADLLAAGPGGTAAVFVTGESGVGKSRLLRETADVMRAAGAAVLLGACLDIGDASPLHPVLQALRQAGAQPGPGPVDAQDGAGALLERVSAELRSLARGRRLLLVLDDLQWADRSTRQLLLYLLAGLGDINLSVLAAVRSESLHGAHPLRRVLAELRRLRSVRVLDLAPLDQDATAELVAAIAGTDVAAEDADRVFKRSGGNPFVAEELARDLRDGRVELSDTLREIFLSRVDELPPHAHDVVHAVAAGVEPVEHSLLARVLPLPEAELIEAVRAAVAHRFLTSAADGYRLRHQVVAEVLEHEVLPAEHAARHRRYAEAIEAMPGEPDHARLAHHWQQAGEPARALPSVVAAARAAERLYGYAEAHRYWALALELAPDDSPQRTDLLAHAAEAAHRCGEHQRALTTLELLAARPDGPGVCEIHLRRARYLAAAGRTATAEFEYERALASPECSASEKASAAANLAELLVHLGRYADAGDRAREALELAERADGSTADLVRASAALGFSLAFREDPDAGLAVIRQAVEIAERTKHPDDIGCAYLHLAELLTNPLNNIEEGVLVARRGAERLAAMGQGRTYQTRLLAIAANGLFRVGQWAEAGQVLDDAMRHRPSGADAVEILLARCRLWVGFGDVRADRDLDAVATILAGGGARHVLPMLTLRAGLAMWQGRHAEARAAVQRGLTETRSDDLVLLGVLAWHGLRAEAEAQAGGEVPVDPAVVRRLQAVVERMARGAGNAAPPVRAVVDGYLDLCAAELSRIEQRNDPSLWARAVQAWDRRKQPYPAAYSRLRQAEASFARRTKRAAATTALREAYETARAMGAKPFAAEITQVAARARVALTGEEETAHPSPARGDDGLSMLTEREREVLAAVAEGLTNREIGQALFISERTVGVHVGHIFDKLQVRTRVQASRVYLRAA